MSSYRDLVLAAAMVGALVAGVRDRAQAQARQAVAVSGTSAMSMNPALPQRDDSEPERDRDPMGTVSIGVKVGMAGSGAGSLTLGSGGQSYTGRIDGRRGLHVAMPLQFGGSGFGFTLEPYLSKSSVGHALKDNQGVEVGAEDADLTAYGLYMGPTVNIQVARPLYLGIGVGLKGAYVMSKAFDLALDAYARAPISATYYVSNQFALVAELGLGYGVSMFADKPRVMFDARTASVRNVKDDPQFGKAFTWDCTLGVRLP